MLEGLHVPSGLETPWDPSGGAGGRCWGEGGLGFLGVPAANSTEDLD